MTQTAVQWPTLDELTSIISGEWVGDDAERVIQPGGFTTDTRALEPGEVFFALRGDRFDAHDFVPGLDRGLAAAAVVARLWYEAERSEQPTIPLIVVDDPLRAWGLLARAWRRRFDIPVFAVAGSNGKTTTKELVAAVLSEKFNVLKTEGNLNNQIGAPATLLRLTPEHEAAVIEIGTNMPGEIEILSNIVEPTHGLITNIGREHLELLGSLEGVAKEEGALFRYLAGSRGTAVVYVDDPHVEEQARGVEHQVRYGFEKDADVRGELRGVGAGGGVRVCVSSTDGSYECDLQLPGEHNAVNALAAAAAGIALGVSLQQVVKALRAFQPLRGKTGYARLAPMRATCGAVVLNDTYNSNPDSTRVALETLKGIPLQRRGRRIVVLGDMKELGVTSAEEHRHLGTELARQGIDVAYFHGAEMRHAHETFQQSGRPSYWFEKKPELMEALASAIGPVDVILVKGSRGMEMEHVVKAICG